MSAAQEQVTGRGKLDLAGVMAALALARTHQQPGAQEQLQRGRPSFLHGRYRPEAEAGDTGGHRVHLPSDTSKPVISLLATQSRTNQKPATSHVTQTLTNQKQATSHVTAHLTNQKAETSHVTQHFTNESPAMVSLTNEQSSGVVRAEPVTLQPDMSSTNTYVNVVPAPAPAAPPPQDTATPPLPPRNPVTSRQTAPPPQVQPAVVRDKGVQEQDKEEEGGRSNVPVPALKSSLGVAKYIRQSANKAENVQQPQPGQVDATLHNETRSVLSAKSMFENNNVSKIEQSKNQMPPAPAVSKSNQDCNLTKSPQQTDSGPKFESRSVLATKSIFENNTSKKEQAKQIMLKQVVPKINGNFQQTKFENKSDVIAEKCAVENMREVPSVRSNLAATSTSSVPDSPETMSRFLSLVERMSEDKERRTGSGRLDMTELEAALTNFQSGSSGSSGSGLTGTGSPPPPPPLSSPPRSSGQRRQDVGEEAAGQHKRSHDTKSSFLNTTLSHTTSTTATVNKA